MKDKKISMTIRIGRKIFKTGSSNLESLVKRLIQIDQDVYRAMQARSLLSQGKSFKYKDRLNGVNYNITINPVVNVEY